MSGSNEKVRYAFGLFGRVEDLERAVAELLGEGVPRSHMKVIVPADDPAAFSREWSRRSDGTRPETWKASEAGGARRWVFAPADSQNGGMDGERERILLADFHSWALERHARQLDLHLRGGGGLLVVLLVDDGEERVACGALLRHASAGIQTHEVGRPRG